MATACMICIYGVLGQAIWVQLFRLPHCTMGIIATTEIDLADFRNCHI